MRILVAPLDWGLGHATRCIPIVRYLLEKKCEVIIGTEGRSLQLLQKELPDLEFIWLPGYNISYPKSGSMTLKIAIQIPKILSGIKHEHASLKKIIAQKKVDAVISDNRFGLWTKDIPCAFITHQLMIKSRFGENIIRFLNKRYISRYSECWIPDMQDRQISLSGELSQKFSLPQNAKFIGPLSRFSVTYQTKKNQNKLLVILSGPEPQRTIFEEQILNELKNTAFNSALKGKSILLVQGITEKNERIKISENIELVSHLTSEKLKEEILASEMILSRSGYSTIMDLALLGKKVIFVPTPGQTEQQYLADYLSEKKIAYSIDQNKFDLNTALNESRNYTGFIQPISENGFKKFIDDFLNTI